MSKALHQNVKIFRGNFLRKMIDELYFEQCHPENMAEGAAYLGVVVDQINAYFPND